MKRSQFFYLFRCFEMDPCPLSNSAENLRTSREHGSLYRLKEGFLSDMRSQRIKVAEKGRNIGKVTKSTSEDPLCRDVEVVVDDDILVMGRSIQADPELLKPRLEFMSALSVKASMRPHF